VETSEPVLFYVCPVGTRSNGWKSPIRPAVGRIQPKPRASIARWSLKKGLGKTLACYIWG